MSFWDSPSSIFSIFSNKDSGSAKMLGVVECNGFAINHGIGNGLARNEPLNSRFLAVSNKFSLNFLEIKLNILLIYFIKF